MKILRWAGWTLAVLAITTAAAAPATAGERLYDKDVRKLIDRANDQLYAFTRSMSGQARSAKITRDGVTVDVGDYLKDFETAGKTLASRYGKSGAASSDALTFLKHGKGVEKFVGSHAGFVDADKEWKSLDSTLGSLAAAYDIDWASEPAGWKARRQSDQEISTLLGGLDRSIKDAGSALDKAAKAAGVPPDSRKSLTTSVGSLRSSAKSLRTAFGSKRPVGTQVDEVLSGAESLAEQANGLGITEAASTGCKPLNTSVAKLGAAFGKT